MMVGFQEDTPQEILEQYKKDQERYKKMQEENPDACIF